MRPVPAPRWAARWHGAAPGDPRDRPLPGADLDAPLPCDEALPAPDHVLVRALEVDAPAASAFRWLCQLKVAPYSYDLVDNLGRRSPRRLTPGADELAVGQRINVLFRVTAFEPGRSITMRTSSRLATVVCTYAVHEVGDGRSRYVVRFLVEYGRGPLGWLLSLLLPAGDLVMMRKQLRTLAALAVSDR